VKNERPLPARVVRAKIRELLLTGDPDSGLAGKDRFTAPQTLQTPGGREAAPLPLSGLADQTTVKSGVAHEGEATPPPFPGLADQTTVKSGVAHEGEAAPPPFPGLADYSIRQTLRPLVSLLAEADRDLRMRAARALGLQAARLADEDIEGARQLMRRLMWMLNHESGSSGWGAPEAMAEIMAGHRALAEEYAHLLVSYMRPDGNYLENPLLQRGLLLGLGRLAQRRPLLLRACGADRRLPAYFGSEDVAVRGLAAWCAGLLCGVSCRQALAPLLGDPAELSVYPGDKWEKTRVMDLAREACERLENPGARSNSCGVDGLGRKMRGSPFEPGGVHGKTAEPSVAAWTV